MQSRAFVDHPFAFHISSIPTELDRSYGTYRSCVGVFHPLFLHELYLLRIGYYIANPGVLPPLPDVVVEEGREVIPSICYQTQDGIIKANWCRTCHFYKYVSFPVVHSDRPQPTIAPIATTALSTLTTTVRRIRPFFLFRWVGQCVGRRNMHYFLWVLVITYLLYHSCM